MEFLRSADALGLKFINGLAEKSVYLDAILIFFAVYLIFILAAGHLIFFWRKKRLDLWFWSLAVTVAAYLTKQIIGLLHFRFRPFVMDGINKLIDKSSAEASFPSGHTLIAFALAFGVFWFNKKWGMIFLIGAFIAALSRIAVGVHYPSDIIAGVIISFLLSLFIRQKLYEKRH